MSINRRITKNEAIRNLSAGISLGTRILRTYETNKQASGLHSYLFGLYAKVVASARSIFHLLEKGHVSDCHLIIRSQFEAALDIEYILHKCRKGEAKTVLKLLLIEDAVDGYEQMEAQRIQSGKCLSHFLQSHPEAAERLKDYRKAKRQYEYGRTQEWPKQWRYITTDEKREALKNSDPLVKYTIVTLGNAFAHSRPVAMRNFMKIDIRAKAVEFKTKITPTSQGVRHAAMYALFPVLGVGSRLADEFELGMSLERSIARLGYRVAPRAFKSDYLRTQ